jgi:hypothetical protein
LADGRGLNGNKKKLAQSKTAAWLANNNPIGFKETAQTPVQNHFMKSTFRLYWCLFG